MRRALIVVTVAVACLAVATTLWLSQGPAGGLGTLQWSSDSAEASPRPEWRLSRVVLGTSSGREVRCTLRLPGEAARAGSLLGVVLLGGIGTGRRAATLVGPEFRGLVLACDHPFADPSDYSAARFLLALPALRRQVLATPEALQLAATYLLSRPETDRSRLAAVGASLGVPAVCAWASGDRRVASVALVMGGADLADLFEANLAGRLHWRPLRRLAASLLAHLLAPLEPTRTVGGIAPRPLLIVGAVADERIPRRSTEALYAAAGPPKQLLWLGGRHMLPRDTLLLRAVTDSTMAWVSGHLVGRP